MARDGARRRAVPALLAVLLGVAPAACCRCPPVIGSPTVVTTSAPPPEGETTFDSKYLLPECPTEWDSVAFSGQHGPEVTIVVPDDGFPVARAITDVPEFHDCQRLVMGDGKTYGPLVAVFAAYDLERIEKRLSLHSVRPAHDTVALAGALILNLGARYPALGIEERFSCLYLWRRAAQWHAKILSVGNDHEKCLQPYQPTEAEVGELRVRRYVLPGVGNPAQYPPVARWDWDDSTKQQYIGLKCGTGWCEIGARTFAPSPPNKVGLPPGSAAVLVRSVKGWYDEQHLAVPAANGSGMVPSGITGTIFPDSSIGDRSENDYRNTWLPVAYIALSAHSQPYKDKLNLDAVAADEPLEAMNRLEYCLGSLDDCEVPPPPPPNELSKMCPTDMSSDSLWWARIHPANGGPAMYRCVTRRGHPELMPDHDIDIPSTVRWRWLAEDETIWKECLEGCCQVESGGRAWQ